MITGDSASDIVGTTLPTFRRLDIRVLYTALAHQDEWQGFPGSQLSNYQNFAESFTTMFDTADLADGEAMITHDAVLTAATAARYDKLATIDPSTVAPILLGFHCQKTIPGASGDIAFDKNGDPIDKAVPIVQIRPGGSVALEELVWPSGTPFDANATC